MRRAVLTFGVLLALFSGSSGVLAQSTIIQRVLVKVNGDFLTQKDLEDKQIEALQSAGKNDLPDDELNKVLAEMMPNLIVGAVDEILKLQRGKELGITMSDEQFQGFLDKFKKDSNMDDAQFKQAMVQDNITLPQLRARIEPRHIIAMVDRQEIGARMNLTEEEARQYYEKHPDEFMKPPTVTLRQILILVPASDARPGQPQMFAQSADAAAKAKIAAIRERALTGEDYEKLVAEASEAPSKSTGGLVTIDSATMATAVRDATDALEPGEISAVLRIPTGYQIFKLESRTTAERLPFDAVRDDVAQKIGEARIAVESVKYLRQLQSQAVLNWKREDLKKIYEARVAELEKQ